MIFFFQLKMINSFVIIYKKLINCALITIGQTRLRRDGYVHCLPGGLFYTTVYYDILYKLADMSPDTSFLRRGTKLKFTTCATK